MGGGGGGCNNEAQYCYLQGVIGPEVDRRRIAGKVCLWQYGFKRLIDDFC